jgi:hypothetical protein
MATQEDLVSMHVINIVVENIGNSSIFTLAAAFAIEYIGSFDTSCRVPEEACTSGRRQRIREY